MNLPEIRTFLAIVETGKLNRAAEQLNVTQSTVTARLNNLEQELGQVLFHRRKSGAELTSAGFRFERYAQLMVDVWRQARQETALPPEVQGTFNLGCHPDLWPGYGRGLLHRIRDSQPGLALSAWPGDQADLERWLGNGLVDAAICYNPTLRDNRIEYRLASERLILVSRHPRGLMRWDPGYIYVDAGEEFRKNHAAAYPDGDTPTLTIGSATWAREYLINKGGSGYLPEGLVANDIAEGALTPVPDAPVFFRNCYLVANRDSVAPWPWFSDTVTSVGGRINDGNG